jgi:DNA-binding HxlR family transcriptional regulator
MPNALSRRIHRCPVTAFQKMISGKYKLRILWDLQDGPLRYGEIRSGLLRGADGSPPIAPRVLSREFKALAQSGLIARKDYGVVPPKVDMADPDRPQLHPGDRRNPQVGSAAPRRRALESGWLV